MIRIKALFGFIYLYTFLMFSATNPEPVTVYLVGDSTMSEKRAEAYPETGWGMPFAQFFDGFVIVENHAKNGRSTRTFLEEGRWGPILNSLQEGDFVFLQFGHNDEIQTKEQSTTEENFKSNLVKYVTETRSRGAVPVLLTPIARRQFEGDSLIDTHKVYSELVREVARSEKVSLIDMDRKSQALLKKLGPEDSKSFFNHLEPGQHLNYPDGIVDNTHFNEYGAQRMAELVLEGILELNLDLTERIVER